jgi:ketosteroid isomerase-like protein
VFAVEAVCHNLEKWDLKEKKSVKARLFLSDQSKGPVMSPDVTWLQSITRPDSGTWFTTSEEKALLYKTEEEADEIVSSLVMEYGYLPGDVVAVKIEPKVDDEQ